MPAPEPRQRWFDLSAARLCAFEWGEPGGAPSILLLHATGFHARCWDQVVARLPGRHVIAVDQRGHGRSARPGSYNWDDFGGDAIELVDALGMTGMVGGGHSMGGHVTLLAAAERPDAFSRLVLVDPVVLSPEAYEGASPWHSLTDPAEHPVARRQDHFASPSAMQARFAESDPFRTWDADVFVDYCTHGLLPRDDGDGFELACPPLVEASVYMGSAGNNIIGRLDDVRCPALVVRARQREGERTSLMDFGASPTWPELAAHLPAGTDRHVPEYSHFIPMEDPAFVAGLLADNATA